MIRGKREPLHKIERDGETDRKWSGAELHTERGGRRDGLLKPGLKCYGREGLPRLQPQYHLPTGTTDCICE